MQIFMHRHRHGICRDRKLTKPRSKEGKTLIYKCRIEWSSDCYYNTDHTNHDPREIYKIADA